MFGWTSLDLWIAVTAALSAMSCAIPGTFLVLRKQSMLGDALSHTVLPGIVTAFLFAHSFRITGTDGTALHLLLIAGAVLAGLATTFLTELVRKVGGVEESAALGVVYSSLFALGLLLIRMFASSVHLDADCVLFGAVETVVLDLWGDTKIPRAAVVNGIMLTINIALTCAAFKELKISTFDPGLAESLGIRPVLINYILMAITSMTLVAAFETVGSILVVTMLVTPASTALLVSHRLRNVLITSIVLAASCSVFGHAFAVTLPNTLFAKLGFTTVRNTNTAGMAALTCGFLFTIALLFSPHRGVLMVAIRNWMLSFRIACEDLLGLLYRSQESDRAVRSGDLQLHDHPRLISPMMRWLAVWLLRRRGEIELTPAGYCLTATGRMTAERIVRSHRLWELYMSQHFPLPDDHLHQTAARVEHFLNDEMLRQLESELSRPDADPHGRSIPPS